MKNYPFPFETYRLHQKRVLDDAIKYLDDGIEVIIIDGPTGFGKSPVNIALARRFKPAFYTTPQVKLVNQLNKDFGQKQLAINGGVSTDIMALLGRRNYICKHSKTSSDVCYVNNTPKYSCLKIPQCTYWQQKKYSMRADVVIITFANLIVNSYLPENTGISFDERNLLIIDECQSLEGQVASMFAGFTISQRTFNYKIKSGRNQFFIIWDDFIKNSPEIPKIDMFSDYIDADDYVFFIEYIQDKLKEFHEFIEEKREKLKIETSNQKIEGNIRQIDFLLEDLKERNDWIINKNYHDGNIYSFEFKPIDVSSFLKEKVWSQAKQIVLSSATIPYCNKIDKWLKRIGLEDHTYEYLSVPSIFPIENRPINFDYLGGSMTSKNEKNCFDTNIQKVREIMIKHNGEKGVIHAVSYRRAKQIFEALNGRDLFLHSNDTYDKKNRTIIEQWIDSGKQCLISPSVTEGVDLYDDLCRFQILIKVPYPNIGDGRIKFLLDKKKDWEYYYNETIMKIVQMYGRAVRSKDDYASFYIVDGSFNNLLKSRRASFQQWFLDAIVK